MERLKKPSTIAALTWLKDRCVSMKVPQSRAMVEKAIEELGYRVPKKPVTVNIHFSGQFLPGCPVCEEIIEDEDYCPNCGQAIDWGDEA